MTPVTTATGQLEYTIVRRKRVTRRLHLELDARGGLIVVAPGHWSAAYIEVMLSENSGRMLRFVADARKRLLPPLQYVSGEQHLYLGELYQLRVVVESARKIAVQLIDHDLVITMARPDNRVIESTLGTWYRQQAMLVFSKRIQLIAAKAPWVDGKIPSLKLQRMRRSWGVCSAKGVIKLNTHLIKTPMAIIDSVIAHELCHLEEMNHGKAFYALLECLNPAWQTDRAILRAKGYIYLHS